jgi:hypothetical protein
LLRSQSRPSHHGKVKEKPPRNPGIGATCILNSFTQRSRHGTGKEEARRQENHFCQTSSQDGKRQETPQV